MKIKKLRIVVLLFDTNDICINGKHQNFLIEE